MQWNAHKMTQAQLASMCQRTSNYSRLTALDLSSLRETKDLTPLSALTSLRDLRLRLCPISSMEWLRGLTLLTHLDIGGTKVTSLEPLSKIVQ